MTAVLVQLVRWMNVLANALGGFLFAPVAVVPGWFSLIAISVLLGVLLPVVFKHTSNQRAIARIRDGMKANLLAVKLFRASISVTLRSQAAVFAGSLKLLFYALVPMLIMIVPISLLLAQMGLWYGARPLAPGEEAVVTLRLNEQIGIWPSVMLDTSPAVQVIVGPVQVLSRKEIYWKIRAVEEGHHLLVFQVDGQQHEKQVVVGTGFRRVSLKRPGPDVADILLHPLERPFGADEPLYSIHVAYPARDARIHGSDRWIACFLVASMVSALIFKPIFKVRI